MNRIHRGVAGSADATARNEANPKANAGVDPGAGEGGPSACHRPLSFRTARRLSNVHAQGSGRVRRRPALRNVGRFARDDDGTGGRNWIAQE